MGEGISSWRQRLHLAAAMVLMLVGMLVPQGAWADSSGLETAFIGDKSYYVLRSSADWDKFRQLVIEANGESDVNAIMDADISTGNSCGDTNFPYCGTFNGNGHTLNVWVEASDEQAPFKVVKNATIRDLRVTGTVKGTSYTGGLIGRILYSGHPTVHVERVWVSANVTSTGWMVSGLIGHASEGIVYMSDSRYDGKLTGNDYKAATVYGDGYSSRFHRVYENATANGDSHFGFSYWWNGSCNAWGHGDLSTSLYSYHNWGEMADGCKSITKQDDVKNKMNAEKANTWHIVDSKAVPVMDTWPSAGDVNFETYDIVPGTEKGEEGMLKIPFSCDQAVKYIDVSYVNENGQTKSIHQDCKDNTYAGFILVPATEQHTSLKITAKLTVGTVTKTLGEGQDAVLHSPLRLSASLLRFSTNNQLADAGAVELKWEVDASSYKDAISSDQFNVMRSLTGKTDDLVSIGAIPFEADTATYTFRDETLMSALAAEHLDDSQQAPQVLYCVTRAAAQQLWGVSNTTAATQTVMPLSQLHLLRVSDYQTAWADQTARTVKVTWQYADEAAAVWDSRAKMNIVVSATNREGNGAGTYLVPLTEADMAARQKVITLDRSCVDYKITFDVERGESAIPVTSSYFEIRTAADWNTFCTMVENAGGKSNVNASLLADISVTNMVGTNSSKPFRGTFEGNGHTLTVNINKNEQCVAPFRYVGNAIIRNLHTAGSVTTNNKFAAGLVSRVSDNYHLLIEGCHVSVDVSSSINGDATNGGIVAIGNNGTTITIQNSKFDGKMRGITCYANGGIVGYTTGEVRIDNTLFDPKEISTNMSSCETWSRKGGSGSVTVTNSHCTKEYKAATTSASEFPGYFIINSSADWNTFCNMVEQAQGNSDVNAVLNADISVTQQAGSYYHRYRGTFDGNGHIININLETDDYGAVFKYASYCTIKNLRVTGNITCSDGNSDAGGIIGSISSYTTSEGYTADIINCRVSAGIKCRYVGGFVGVALKSKITLTNCLFDGNLVGHDSYSRGSAFVGRRDSDDEPPTLNNCLDNGTYQNFYLTGLIYNGTAQTPAGSNNWSYNGLTGATAVGSLSVSDLAAKLGSGWKVADGNAVPVILPKAASGNVAGKTTDQIVALLGSGWQKDASGNPVPKMANNAQGAVTYSAKHPFNIHTAEDWDAFRKLVAETKGQKDIYAQLLADISVTTPVGDTSAPYRGTFDGNGHTLTFNVSNSNQMFIAPFVSVNAATIRNLHTTGSISTSNMRAAGLVGQVPENGKLLIEGCHVSMDIYSSVSGDTSSGGIVAGGGYSNVSITIRNTKFDGKMRGSSSNANSGIVGWCTAQVLIENTLFDPAEISTDPNYSQTWCRIGGTGSVTTNNCYCTREFNGNAGNAATKTAAELVKALGSQWWQLDAVGRAVPKTVGGVIDGMLTFYYENLGHIDKNSLQVTTLPTSTVLTWANQTDEPVDYYEVWRRDAEHPVDSTKCIATQLTEMQYEDKATSPVHQYIYKVRGVTSCEGLHYDETKEVEGMCEQTATVEGYLRFLDGTGIPGEQIIVTVDGKERPTVTDESGFFRFKELPYKDKQETTYKLATTLSGVGGTVTFGTDAGENVVKNVVIEVASSVKISGTVQYEGTSIPVQGVSFKVNGHEVRNSAGLVTTDHEGKFAFRMLPGDASIQAVKDGHDFWRDGFYHLNDDDPDTLKTYNFQTDKAGLMFYDQTRVKLIGRIVGGKTQGELPLGYGLSQNNLGDSLRMVLTLEGDNVSRLVFDIQDRTLKERDETFLHELANAKDKKTVHQTRVHTTQNRMVVYPDALTGEYEVLLPPVKWKIQQITASGYATLFQDGQTGDVIDLTDSLTEHKDELKGTWKKATYTVTDPVEEYYAKYNRIYHSPVLIEYRQQGFDPFDYFGERYYSYQNLSGTKEKLALAYGVRKPGWPQGKRDSLETRYTFGHPVFNIDRKYGFTISAIEKYYYNNNPKSDTIDVVHLEGGVVTIHNGMVSATHRDTLQLDSLGQGNYTIEAAQTPYLLTGDDALHTVTMTLEMDGTHYEAEPLKAYVLNVKPKDGAKDILSFSTPQLIDILRDPPGGTSHATLSKGSTLKYAYQMDMSWSAGVSITMSAGGGVSSFTGVVAAPMGVGAVGGFHNTGYTSFATSLDLVWSGSGNRAFSYTMTATEDISTSSDKTLVGADGDLYMGVVQNIVVKPATAIRAIPHSAFQQMAGSVEKGRMVEIAQGRDDRDSLLHFVRDEVVTYGPELKSNFVHSQHYIVHQLIPELAEQIFSMMFIGTAADAKAKANSTGKPVYRSLVGKDDPEFGAKHKYEIVYPDNYTGNQVDSVSIFRDAMRKWVEMIAQNEKEKLSVTANDLVQNFDVDGGGSVNYGESFASDYSNTSSFVNPITPMTTQYFDNTAGDVTLGVVAILGPTVAKLLGSVLKTSAGGTTSSTGSGRDEDGHMTVEIEAIGTTFKFGLIPSMSFNVTPKSSESKSYNRKESFTIGMDKRSHLNFDVYRVKTQTDHVASGGVMDVFVGKGFYDQLDYDYEYLKRDLDLKNYVSPRSFVYRTRGGATCRPWEDERKTLFHEPGKVMDERTKKIENPQITMDKQSQSGVPFGEPARFKLYITNESEQPEAAYIYFDLYQVDKTNPHGARIVIDGVPLTGNSRTIEVRPGQVTEKTLDVYANEVFDYEGLKIGLISQGDINCYQEVAFDVHFLQTAGSVAISSPGDKWIMNCDAPTDGSRGWYLPVVISGFNKNQKNFDHIEFQYKETTRGDDYWTNLCGYYADSTLYRAASGTKEMIPENGNIQARFFGEGTVIEKGYDLRAVLFCRNGNAFLTSESKVLGGIKDTRRPQLFGTPEPKSGVLGPGENIIFDFSEDIEYNYLQATTNFEVVGETNETAVQEAPSLQFGGNGYAQTQSRRNFANKDVTIEVMIKPEDTSNDMPVFSHGSEGKSLQLWFTKERRLKAVVNNGSDTIVAVSDSVLQFTGFQRVAMVLDNENKRLMLYGKQQVGSKDNVVYSGTGQLTFGAAEDATDGKEKFFKGRMLQGRLWYRTMDLATLNRYSGRLLTGYELGLADYYPMNDGSGDYAADQAQGAHLMLSGASWAQPEGMSLRIDSTETRKAGEYKGLQLRTDLFQRDDEQDYTLMFWFKTAGANGTLMANGSGKADDEGAKNKFFIGFEDHVLKYRTNGREFTLGDDLCNDAWHHYAMTVNRARNVASIYIDNVAKAQLTTDTLGGMLGTRFFLGNTVYQENGKPEVKQENAYTGHIDGLMLFEQALPTTLIRRYSTKSPGGEERGLIAHMPFDHQVRQKSGELALQPWAMSTRVKRDNDGNDTGKRDSVFVDSVDKILSRIDRTMGAPVQPYEHLRNLNFSYVGRNNQLLVNIDEQDSRINKQNVYVTLYDIPDKNGNHMKSPVTESFYINRNPLTWMSLGKHRVVTIQQGESLKLVGIIENNGGKAHTYTIENLPSWITVDKTSDIVEPQTTDEVDFTISPDLEVGTYDQMIYLVDEDGMSDAYYLELTVEGEAPDWTVAPEMKRYSMNIVAQVFVNNDLVTDSRDIVGAFDGTGRCMGVNNIEYDSATGRSMLFMTVYDSTTVANQLTFRLWHYATGKTMKLTPTEFINFGDQAIVGTVDKPVGLYSEEEYLQKLDLARGWNWVSFNVYNQAFASVESILSRFPWQEGDILTEDSEDLTLTYRNGQWMSNSNTDISRIKLSQQYSYRVKVGRAQQIEIWGSAYKRQADRTVKVKPGWNSIGYTPMVNLPVSTALTDYFDEAMPGDVVKNQHTFAMFTADGKGGGEWLGTLKYMKPGEGYMLHRQGTTEAQFCYPYYEPGTTFIENSVNKAPQRGSNFSTTMSVVAEAVGVDVEEGDRLVAYAGGEAVGSVECRVQSVEFATAAGTPLFFLSIEGDIKAPLSFAIERGDDLIAVTGEVMKYEPDGISGSPEIPTQISFVTADQLPQHGWYTVQGIKLPKAPTQSGVYIYNGKKQVIK